MCVNWNKKEIIMSPAEMRMISIGRNVYSGGNGLNGCVNDTINFPNKMLSPFPSLDIRRFADYKATAANYKAQGSAAIATLSPGATVCIIADSCFSGGITRGNPNYGAHDGFPIKNRFYLSPRAGTRPIRAKQLFVRGDLRWLVISGCQENGTSADAFFKKYNQYMGALSYSLMETIEKGMTWQEWYDAMMIVITAAGFDQIPSFEGPDVKKNEIIGSSETLILHNSSHGTQVVDRHGDEIDLYDEALYLDKVLIDDEIGVMLDGIPSFMVA
jgi:hypothetical protein